MNTTSPYMVIHQDVDTAAKIRQTVLDASGDEVICIHSAIDGIPAFESHQPHTVILSAELTEMPLPVLVNAFRNLSSQVLIWICAESLTPAVDAAAAEIKADRLLVLPLRADFFSLPAPAPVLHQEDALERTLIEAPEANAMLRDADPAEGFHYIDAGEINFAGRYHSQGNLKVIGDLREVDELKVDGRLVVEGNIIDSHIKAQRGMTVEGQIVACKGPGIFTRGVLDVARAVDSVLVCGNNLYFGSEIRDCLTNVVLRLCSKDHAGGLIGGWARVGEYVDVGVLGDPDQKETEVHIAPAFLNQSWLTAKRRFLQLAVGFNPHLALDQRKLFESHLQDPNFYPRLGALRANRVHPGITVKIGDLEEYLFQPEHHAIRLETGKTPCGKTGIVKRKLEAGRAPSKLIIGGVG